MTPSSQRNSRLAVLAAGLVLGLGFPLPADASSATLGPWVVEAGQRAFFEFEMNVAARLTFHVEEPSSLEFVTHHWWAGVEWDQASLLRYVNLDTPAGGGFGSLGSQSGPGEMDTAVAEYSLKYRGTDIPSDELNHFGGGITTCCLVPGTYVLDFARGASVPVTRSGFEAVISPPVDTLWEFTPRVSFLSLRDFSSAHSAARVLGYGASVALDSSLTIRPESGFFGKSWYVSSTLDFHQFDYSGPAGSGSADDHLFDWEAPGEYTFDLSYQASAGDWPGRVAIIYADLPDPRVP